MQYIYNRKDENTGEITQEKVNDETWHWGVVYNDNTELHQFDANGEFHQFGEIVFSKVKMFVMYKGDNIETRIDMPVSKGMQIFHFYRNVVIEMNTPNERRIKVYVFGWKRNGVSSYNFILPDGRMIVSNGDNVNLLEFGL